MSESVPKVFELVPTNRERDFEVSQREAKALAASALMPEAFRGNIPNAMIALNMAKRTGFDPLAVAQSMYIVHGKPSFSSSFLIASFNACGRFGPIRYQMTGEGKTRACTAYTTDVKTGDQLDGPTVSIKMAEAEGWTSKKGSKWLTMPDLMLRYRAAAFLIRTTAPEVSLGMHTTEELQDIRPERTGATAISAARAIEAARDVTPSADVPLEEPGAGDTSGPLDSLPPDEMDESDRAFYGVDNA